jgi:hypothetical protein
MPAVRCIFSELCVWLMQQVIPSRLHLRARHTPARCQAVSASRIYIAAAALTVTTTVSTLVLAGCAQEQTINPDAFESITKNRATVQLVVQIVSNILGLLCNTTITVLIFYGPRSNLWQRPVKLKVPTQALA